MKKTIVFALIVFEMAVVNIASAELVNGINFLSREYTASGEFQATILTGTGYDDEGELQHFWGTAQDSYSFSSQSNPINYDYTYFHSNVDSLGEDLGSTSVIIGHNSGHLYVSTYAYVGAPEDLGWVNSYTTGNWDFQPQYSDMELRFNIDGFQGWDEPIGSIFLQDLTTGALFINIGISYEESSMIEFELNNDPFYSVDPTHTYRLTLESRGSSQQGEGYLGGGIEANIFSVPEPATLLLLGLGGLILRKRKV